MSRSKTQKAVVALAVKAKRAAKPGGEYEALVGFDIPIERRDPNEAEFNDPKVLVRRRKPCLHAA